MYLIPRRQRLYLCSMNFGTDKSIFRKFLAATWLTVLTCLAAADAQQVWPGDVNNNGIVNEVDLLYWGLAHGSTGDARNQTGVNWQAYDPPVPWALNFPNGINYFHADCNGDGIVDEADYDDAIDENFGLQHQTPLPEGYSNAAEGSSAPKLHLQPDAQLVGEGAVVNIALSLDDAPMSIDSFYGIALSLSYTTGLLEGDDGPDFDLQTGNWIESDSSYVETLYHETDAQGKAALAITRTNQSAVPAQAGVIGNFSIVIEDIIVGLVRDTFYLQVDSILLITPDFTTISVVPDTAQIIIVKNLAAHDAGEAASVRIYPKPAGDEVFIKSEYPLTNPVLLDPLGRIMPAEWKPAGQYLYRLNCTELPPGLYWLWAQDERGAVVEKIIITH